MDKKPERIYLQWYNEDGDPATEEEEVCWCEDRVYNTDIEYVSAEIVDELRRQLEEARATILEIMTELTKAGYQFMHEGEEPVIECCDCEFPLAEGHADDCNRPR
jgi:hypothetical protein